MDHTNRMQDKSLEDIFIQNMKMHTEILKQHEKNLLDLFSNALQKGFYKVQSKQSQSKNKIKYITGVASLIQSLDSIDTLLFIDEYSKKNGIVQNVLLQFNISDESQKNGFAINDYKMVYDKSLKLNNINVLGLMGMAKYTDDISVINKEFESLKVIYDSIKSEYRNEIFNILSMGMSSDYEVAIKQGSNMVRIGSTLFEDLI